MTDLAPSPTTTIRAALVTERGIVLTDRPVPEPGLGQVQLAPLVVGLCGSDVHAAAGKHPWMRLPYAPGHEVVAVVRALGEGVDGVAVGDRVVLEPTLPCWNCKQCRAGRQNLCEHLEFVGCGFVQGGLADLLTVPADRLHPLPPTMSDLDAALVEPLATPVHAVRLAAGEQSLAGRTVVVIGGGTIGQFVFAAARHRGADRVVVVDPMPAKRDLARARGAVAAIDPNTEDVVDRIGELLGESTDFVFDCVGIEATLAQGIALADRAGTVVVVGVPTADVSMSLELVQDRQIRIQGAATYLPEDYTEAIEMIAAGVVDAGTFVTAEYSMDELPEALAAATDPATMKVVVRPRPGSAPRPTHVNTHDSTRHKEQPL